MIRRFNKKGLSPIGLLGEILIVLVVIIILLAIVIVPKLTTQSDIVGVQIGGIQGDADKDSIRNFLDKCPCTFGDSISEGCPTIFTDEQKKEDLQKYNSKPVCGIEEGQPPIRIGVTTVKHITGKESEKTAAEPKQYQSIELFAGDDGGADPADEIIKLACAGWVGGTGGASCHSEDDDCDSHFNLKPLKEGCWIMASEDDDTDSNDCGQAKVDDGTIIPQYKYDHLNVDVINNYLSLPNEGDPKNLFSWRWKSKDEYGSLLCNKGAWYGCREANEGKIKQVNGQDYKCTGRSWEK